MEKKQKSYYNMHPKLKDLDNLNKLFLIVNNGISKYPYNLNEDPIFTQNEMILYYKSNYLLSDNKENIKKDGGKLKSVELYTYL